MAGEHVGHDLGDVVGASGEVGEWGCGPSKSVNEVISDLNGGVTAGNVSHKFCWAGCLLARRQSGARMAPEWRPSGHRKSRQEVIDER
jgi:hypothetical protein